MADPKKYEPGWPDVFAAIGKVLGNAGTEAKDRAVALGNEVKGPATLGLLGDPPPPESGFEHWPVSPADAAMQNLSTLAGKTAHYLGEKGKKLDQFTYKLAGLPEDYKPPFEDPLSGHTGLYSPEELEKMPRTGFFEGWAHALPFAAAIEATGPMMPIGGGGAVKGNAMFPSQAESLKRMEEEAVFRDRGTPTVVTPPTEHEMAQATVHSRGTGFPEGYSSAVRQSEAANNNWDEAFRTNLRSYGNSRVDDFTLVTPEEHADHRLPTTHYEADWTPEFGRVGSAPGGKAFTQFESTGPDSAEWRTHEQAGIPQGPVTPKATALEDYLRRYSEMQEPEPAAMFPTVKQSEKNMETEAVLRDQLESQGFQRREETTDPSPVSPRHKAMEKLLKMPGVDTEVSDLANLTDVESRDVIPVAQDAITQRVRALADQDRQYGVEDQSRERWNTLHEAGGGTYDPFVPDKYMGLGHPDRSPWNYERAPGVTKKARPEYSGEHVHPVGRTVRALQNNIDANASPARGEHYGLVSAPGDIEHMGADTWVEQLRLELENDPDTAGAGSMADEKRVPIERPGWIAQKRLDALDKYLKKYGGHK